MGEQGLMMQIAPRARWLYAHGGRAAMTFRYLRNGAAAIALAALSACATLDQAEMPPEQNADIRPELRPDAVEAAARPVLARTVDEFDTTTPEERRAATRPQAAGETELGMTVASLGAPAEPGFWLRTPLVSSPAKGRVVYPNTGKSVNVELLPRAGPASAGSQMSLAAMRVIEAPLTDLPQVRVFRMAD